MKILYATPGRYDYLAATLVEGLSLLGHTLATTTPHNGGTLVLEEPQAFDFGKHCDLIIEGSNSGVNRLLVRKLDTLNRTVYVDGSDFVFPEKEGSAFSFLDYPVVFKREMKLTLNYPNNYKPLLFASLSTQRRSVPFEDKTDFCTSTLRAALNPHRAVLVDQITRYNKPEVIKQLPDADLMSYCYSLAASHISVSQRGWGWDTLRFWQIVGCGTVVAADKADIQFPYPYTRDVNFIEWSNWEELISKVNYYARHKDQLRAMTDASIRHTATHHTSIKRAGQFLTQVPFL